MPVINYSVQLKNIRRRTCSILFLLNILWLISCNGNDTRTTAPEEFTVTEVIETDTSAFTDYVAEIHSIQNVEIRSKVNGFLEKIYIDEGKYVGEGQLLFSINSVEYQQELAKARALYKSALAELKSVQLELKNAQQLFTRNVISVTELEIAKNKLEASKARVEEALANQAHAENKLSFTSIRAPFSGITNKIPFKTGSLINEGSLLTTISDNREVFAYFDVSEKEYLAYAGLALKDSAISKRVALILADGHEHTEKGKIETIEGEIDSETGNIAFRARFKNPDRILKHGASGKVRLTKHFENALIIPQKATFEIQDKIYVYVLTKENKVETRTIIPEKRLSHLFILKSGLQKGDRILYEGVQNVKDGMVIQPKMVSMSQIMRELNTKN